MNLINPGLCIRPLGTVKGDRFCKGFYLEMLLIVEMQMKLLSINVIERQSNILFIQYCSCC